jgi:bifunctional pyridoxal-dependent enzyme with beta-cystathionase and maltose regulon repressor activities
MLRRPYPNHDATYLMWLDARPLLPLLPEGSDPASFFLEKVRQRPGAAV